MSTYIIDASDRILDSEPLYEVRTVSDGSVIAIRDERPKFAIRANNMPELNKKLGKILNWMDDDGG